jgi:hypothetical protein
MVTTISKEPITSMIRAISLPKIRGSYPDNGDSRLLQKIVIVYQTARCGNPEDQIANIQGHENLKSHFNTCFLQELQKMYIEF